MTAETIKNSSEPPLLFVKNLGRFYGRRKALADVEFSVSSGEVLVIQGPNGAGKTSLLSALISRNSPDTGQIFYAGQETNDFNSRRAYLADSAYLGHEPGLFYDLTALENLQFFTGLYEQNSSTRNVQIPEILEICALFHRRFDRVRGFSRGMKQRLALARIFLQAPRLLYLDEPLTGLDRQGETVLLELLSRHSKTGGGALVVTHTDTPFHDVADRYLFLKDGRLVADIERGRYTPEARKKVGDILYQ